MVKPLSAFLLIFLGSVDRGETTASWVQRDRRLIANFLSEKAPQLALPPLSLPAFCGVGAGVALGLILQTHRRMLTLRQSHLLQTGWPSNSDCGVQFSAGSY